MAVKKKQSKKKTLISRKALKKMWEDRAYAGVNVQSREVIFDGGRREKVPSFVDINMLWGRFEETNE